MGLSNLVDLINLVRINSWKWSHCCYLWWESIDYIQCKKYYAFNINIKRNVCVYIDGFLWGFEWFIPLCSKEKLEIFFPV